MRLLHISDVHFGPPHRPQAAAGVRALVAARRPDLVVLSGDLTQRAKPAQFREARAFVDSLEAPVLAVPGNHDVPLYRVFERALAPYSAYRTHFAPDLEPVFEQPGLLVAGLNSAFNWTLKNGLVRLRSLAAVADRMRAAPAETLKVAVIHHPLVRLPGFPGDLPAANAREALEALADAGCDLVLGGHLHQGFAGRTEDFHGVPGPLLCYAGTATSRRGRCAECGICSCNWIETDASSVAITRLVSAADSEEFVPAETHRFPRRAQGRAVRRSNGLVARRAD